MHSDPASVPLVARRNGPLAGRVRVPGDKSISIRALILGALTVGETRVSGLLEGEDVLNTAKALQALGARLARTGERAWSIHGTGVGGFAEPRGPLDFGNSGTGCRLALGAVAGCPITATFDGDASLRSRPMRRVLDPLERIGARAVVSANGRLPLTLKGARDPMPIVFEPPVPSAQLKSATLLGRPCGARRDGRRRSRGDARSHRENAHPFRRASARRSDRQRRPPHHADRPAGTRAAAGRGAGRSVLGGVSADRGAAGARLRGDPRRRDDEPAAHRAAHHADGDGRLDRAARRAQ